jgi:PKD repeat protein
MRQFRFLGSGYWIVLLSILVASAAGAVNINGSGASLSLPTTDFSSGGDSVNGAGVRLIWAGTPASGVVSTNASGAKLIVDPMSAIAGQDAPAVDFTANPWSGGAPLNVQFTAQATGGLYDILAWTWDFGDGTPTSSERNPTHTYGNPGVYTVTLTITTEAGSISKTKASCISVSQGVPAVNWAGMAILVLTLTALGATKARKQISNYPVEK